MDPFQVQDELTRLYCLKLLILFFYCHRVARLFHTRVYLGQNDFVGYFTVSICRKSVQFVPGCVATVESYKFSGHSDGMLL